MASSDTDSVGEDTLAPSLEPALSGLRQLHARVDARALDVARRNAGRLQCGRGCADCCRDDLEVFEIEAANIRSRHPQLLKRGTPHAPGACAFLAADRSCRIYAERPYVCRTQGLPLRWFEDPGERGLANERRDICPLNAAGVPIENLTEDSCWSIGPVEARLAALQNRLPAKPKTRVRLRDLFIRRL